MDVKEEYHDPDYPEILVCVKEEPPSASDEEKVEKIKEIIRREFLNELDIRENEVMLLDQRLTTSRRLLHRLRYSIVSSYYNDQKLQLTNGQVQDEIAAQHEPRARAEVAAVLRDGQRRLHPSVRKLLGKQSVDISEIFKSRTPRNKTRRDYSAMLQKRNYTISADTTKTLRPDSKLDEPPEAPGEPGASRPKKVPRHLEPRVTNVVTFDEATRNKTKHRYRIIIGNTSKYAPAASRADRSTHKWLLYVRGASLAADLSALVTSVTVSLHHSYAPHHTVHLDKPPYHVSRRGWGEFPAKVELHFALPERNRPATVEHTIKLDRKYTGLQMLGAETLVDVWLYSTPEMLQHEYKEDDEVISPQLQPQTKPTQTVETKEESTGAHTDDWLDFFAKGPTEVDVDEMFIKPIKKEKIEDKVDLDNVIASSVIDRDNLENHEVKVERDWCIDSIDPEIPNEILSQPTSPKKRIVKYIDPTTGKIYYLEMDRNLDLSKVQEIVINNTKTTKISPVKSNGLKNVRKRKGGGVSLLKPEVKNMLKNTDNTLRSKINYAHIENDHCYLATPRKCELSVADLEIKKEKSLHECLCAAVRRLTSVRAAVNYLLKKIPLISDEARDTDFTKHFPFVVETEDRYWKLDFAKRRNIEWSRAKLINKIITDNFTHNEPIWRTRQILHHSRLHGHYPVRSDAMRLAPGPGDCSSWDDAEHQHLDLAINDLYQSPSDINSLSVFNETADSNVSDVINLADEDVDVVSDGVEHVKVKKEAVAENESLTMLPVEGEDRLRYLYIEKKCSDIGIELRNEDIGSGYSHSAVHAVILSAMKNFAEELIRSGLAAKLSHESAHSGQPTVWAGSSSCRACVGARALHAAARDSPRLRAVTRAHTGAPDRAAHAL